MTKDTLDLTPNLVDNFHPGFSVDCVIISFHKKKLYVLLNKFDESDLWQLPGGFMMKDESADDAATRVLQLRTGLTNIYLRQFYLFSDPQRTDMEQNRLLASSRHGSEWLMQRFISLGYYALVKYDDVKLSKMEGETVKWHDVSKLSDLYSDHAYIIKKSKETLQGMIRIIPIGPQLLPEKFTLSELRRIYEMILDRTFDRRNFQRKVLASGLVTQLDETKTSSTYNPPALYSFNEQVKDSIDYGTFL